jgi:hypothetical protein
MSSPVAGNGYRRLRSRNLLVNVKVPKPTQKNPCPPTMPLQRTTTAGGTTTCVCDSNAIVPILDLVSGILSEIFLIPVVGVQNFQF